MDIQKYLIKKRILANKVQLSGGISFGTGYGKEYVVAAVDPDQLSKTYSLVINPKDGLKTKVFHSKIPDEVRDHMLAGYEMNGMRLSYQEMAIDEFKYPSEWTKDFETYKLNNYAQYLYGSQRRRKS